MTFVISAPFQCPAGTMEYTYDTSSLDGAAVNILWNGTEVQNQVSSATGISSDTSVTLEIKLTPEGRSSNIYIQLEAIHATSVTFLTDNNQLGSQQVITLTLVYKRNINSIEKIDSFHTLHR